MSALETSLTEQLMAELERGVRLQSQVVQLTERLALAHQHAEALQAEVYRLQRLLEEAAEELQDGLTSSERAARDAWLDEVEAAS